MSQVYDCGCRRSGGGYYLCDEHEDKLLAELEPPIVPRHAIKPKRTPRSAMQILDDMQQKIDDAIADEVTAMRAAADAVRGPIRTDAEARAEYVRRHFSK